MLKRCLYYGTVLGGVAFLSASFIGKKESQMMSDAMTQVSQFALSSPSDVIHLMHPTELSSLNQELKVPFKGRYFIAFKEELAKRESQGQYQLINTLGYMGKYQFGASALRTVGITDFDHFLINPRLQEKAFIALLSRNKHELRNEIEQYSGKVVAGVEVTESGILAAAHLGGPGSVKRFFKTKGKRAMKDDYGTSLKSYMRHFAGYDTSHIPADPNAKVKM